MVEYNDGYGNTEPPIYKSNKMKKAHERKKTTLPTSEIEKKIDEIEKNNLYQNKIFIEPFYSVSDETKLEFINAGYKVYFGDWDGIMRNVLIIEW